MVGLDLVQKSNAQIKSTFSNQVALFVGATSGIAFHTLIEYVRNSNYPKVYFVGRGADKLAGVVRTLSDVNSQGTYISIQSEISLLKNVDKACEDIIRQESRLDLLLMCPGYPKLSRKDNSDGLEEAFSLHYYVRMRFVHNLLPLLCCGPSSRVVSIHMAGHEGRLIEDDLELKHNWSFPNAGKHTATMNTLALTEISSLHPSISCIHVFPGWVITQGSVTLSEDWFLPLRLFYQFLVTPLAKLFTTSLPESGQRHLFHATSARYPPADVEDQASMGVAMPDGVDVAVGSDWNEGSGCYVLGPGGEVVGNRKLLDEYFKRGMGKKIWQHTQEVFDRVLGTA